MKRELSFIIPVYNGQKYILRCLASILNIDKNHFDIEVIVVDDGSTDDTASICEKISQNDYRMKYIYKDNGGVSSARNLGLSKAVGRYIIFIDVDDEFCSENFCALYSEIVESDGDVFIFDYAAFNEKGEKVFSPNINLDSNVDTSKLQKRFVSYPLLDRLGSSEDYLGAKVYQYAIPKQMLEENQIRFNESIHFAEDLCFLYTVMRYAVTCKYIPGVYYKYNIIGNSVSHTYRNNFWEDWEKVLHYIKQQSTSNDEYEKVKLGVYCMELHYYADHLSLAEYVDVVEKHFKYSTYDKKLLSSCCNPRDLYQSNLKKAILSDNFKHEYMTIKYIGLVRKVKNKIIKVVFGRG